MLSSDGGIQYTTAQAATLPNSVRLSISQSLVACLGTTQTAAVRLSLTRCDSASLVISSDGGGLFRSPTTPSPRGTLPAMNNLIHALAAILIAAYPTVNALLPDAPPPPVAESKVSNEEVAFASEFVPIFISGYVAFLRGDIEHARRAVLAGKAAGFEKRLTSSLGGLTMEVPGLKGEGTFRWYWSCLDEACFPTRDFS